MSLSGDDWQRIVVIALAVAAMAFAGVAQTLIGVTSRQRLRGLVSGPESSSGSRTVQSIADPRRALFATMLLVQVVAAIVASVQMESLLNEHWQGSDYSWIASLVVVLLYLVFGQALPRALAAKDLERFLSALIRIAQVLTTILRPVTWLVDRVALLF
ncbi:MAG: CNNM domain-containing protein, partial [Thermomicrobiales bacterium]